MLELMLYLRLFFCLIKYASCSQDDSQMHACTEVKKWVFRKTEFEGAHKLVIINEKNIYYQVKLVVVSLMHLEVFFSV